MDRWSLSAVLLPFVLCLPQYDTEQLLADAATRAGLAIDRGVELAGITQATRAVVPPSLAAALRRRSDLHASSSIRARRSHPQPRAQLPSVDRADPVGRVLRQEEI